MIGFFSLRGHAPTFLEGRIALEGLFLRICGQVRIGHHTVMRFVCTLHVFLSPLLPLSWLLLSHWVVTDVLDDNILAVNLLNGND